MVTLAHAAGWSVYCVATPAAAEHFLDVPALENATRHQVRTTYRKAGDEPLPRADGVIVAPATYNTINKWASGAADTYALNQLAELVGLGVPVVVLPFVNQALAANPVFDRSVNELRQAGVRVLYGPGEFEPHPPRTGGTVLDTYPWRLALEALNE
jgi:phosphopantothenoylcysteine synthetase/decarboxylase